MAPATLEGPLKASSSSESSSESETMRMDADATLSETTAEVETLGRRELGEKLVGVEGIKGAQVRLKKYLDGEGGLVISITDPKIGRHENAAALQGAAKELWLLKRAGQGIKPEGASTINQRLVKEVNRHAGVMAETLRTGRIGDEDALALGRLSYAGFLDAEVQQNVKKGLENILTKKQALDQYEGDVSVLLMTARQVGVFEKGSEFIQNKGTWPEVQKRLKMELEEIGKPWPGESDDVRAASRLALRRTRLKATGMEALVPEAEAALPNDKLEAACVKAMETKQVGPLARLRRSQASLISSEEVPKLSEAEKKLFLGYAGELQRHHGRSRRFLRFAGDVFGIFKKEPLKVDELAAMGDLEERPKPEKKWAPEQQGQAVEKQRVVEVQERKENQEQQVEKKNEQNEEEEENVFKKLFGPAEVVGNVESAEEEWEEEEEKGVFGRMWEAIKKFWEFLKSLWNIVKPKVGSATLGKLGLGGNREEVEEEEHYEPEEFIEEEQVVESGAQNGQSDGRKEDPWQTQEYMAAPKGVEKQPIRRNETLEPVKVQVGEGDLDKKSTPVEDEPWKTKTYLVGAGLEEDSEGKEKEDDADSGLKSGV